MSLRRCCGYVGLSVITLLGIASTARAQSSENVAVVINDASPISQRIGEYYARKRAIPDGNIIHIRTATDEQIWYMPQLLEGIEGQSAPQ